MELLIATTNPGKVREIERALAGLRVKLKTLNDFAPVPEPDEAGLTFADNARLKADYYARSCGLATIAEDSGLEIDALGGRPGVQSARYPGATYTDKFANLYSELADRPKPWTARFLCSLALVDAPQGNETPLLYSTEGTVEGEIAPKPRGTKGFGYDPIFVANGYDQTIGELDPDEKHRISHRADAFMKLVTDQFA